MRVLFLIFAASVASQLPARDVPYTAEGVWAGETVHAQPRACRKDGARSRPFIAIGPTVFAAPGSIA